MPAQVQTTDTIARTQGYTRAVVADCDLHTLELLIKPDADLDGTFRAWDRDQQEWLRVNGWLFVIEDDEVAR